MIQAYIVKLIVEDSYCGTYTENVAPTQPTTNVTEPTTEPTSIQTKNYVYFNNTENWSTVNVITHTDLNFRMVQNMLYSITVQHRQVT